MFNKIHNSFHKFHVELDIDNNKGLLPKDEIPVYNRVFNIAIVFLALSILIINVFLNFVLRIICFITTSMENHKTEYDYEDSFNLKFFSLSLCTHFIPIVT